MYTAYIYTVYRIPYTYIYRIPYTVYIYRIPYTVYIPYIPYTVYGIPYTVYHVPYIYTVYRIPCTVYIYRIYLNGISYIYINIYGIYTDNTVGPSFLLKTCATPHA